MSETSQTYESQISKVVSAVWHSPTETPLLSLEREKAKLIIESKMARLTDQLKAQKKDNEFSFNWCAIPVGSVIYGRSNFIEGKIHRSDYDYVVYVDDQEAYEKIKSEKDMFLDTDCIDIVNLIPVEFNDVEKKVKGDVFGMSLQHDIMYNSDTPVSATLLVPDEYVSGNLEMLRLIRSKFIQVLKKLPNPKKEFAYEGLKREFFLHFVNVGSDRHDPFSVTEGRRSPSEASSYRSKNIRRIERLADEVGARLGNDEIKDKILLNLGNPSMESNAIMSRWPTLDDFITDMEGNNYIVSSNAILSKKVWGI